MDSFNLLSNPRLWVAALAVWVVSRVIKLRKGVQSVNNLRGFRVPFPPFSIPGALCGTRWWNPSIFFPWHWRTTLYKGYDTFSLVPFVFGEPCVYSSNLDVMRQVIAGPQRGRFVKTPAMTLGVRSFGENVLSAEGEVWRRHRRVVGPAFTTELYKLVWAQSLTTYHEMQTAENWVGRDIVEINAVQHLTMKFALLIIARCGFGFSFDWTTPPATADGEVSIQEELHLVSENHVLLTLAPKWLFRIPFFGLRQMGQASVKLERFMRSEIAERRAELGGETSNTKKDVFTTLIKANEGEDSKSRLDDDELIGNVYILLVAGHETTAHALDTTLAYLAMYQDIQNELYEQIMKVVGSNREPSMDDYPLLDKVLAAFVESVRLYPPAIILIRDTIENSVVTAPNPFSPGETQSIVVPPKGQLVVDVVGVLRSPHYFEDPNSYKPSRWYGQMNEAENMPGFNLGPRVCVGKKFAVTEAVCFLASLLRDWKVEGLLRNGETQQQWRDRVLKANFGMTLGIKNVPLRFVRRRKAETT